MVSVINRYFCYYTTHQRDGKNPLVAAGPMIYAHTPKSQDNFFVSVSSVLQEILHSKAFFLPTLSKSGGERTGDGLNGPVL